MNKEILHINPTMAWSDVTGAFCRHWGEAQDCDIECLTCGHRCTDHDYESGVCAKCGCAGWTEEEKGGK